ncbi:hypothetical protein [Yoonia sp.]|uniref:hypothetical protein n=1 Tax=Yoonia sp. TaxID=2212373 RepID=UPI003975911B
MDEHSRIKPNISSRNGIGFVLAAVLVVLVLLYALFAGGRAPVDPAAVDTTGQGAPALEDMVPPQPAAPATGE